MATAVLTTTAPSARRRPWHAYRREIETTIDRLITILNEIDGDSDLEPSLGAIEAYPRSELVLRPRRPGGYIYGDRVGDQRRWAGGTTDDREQAGGDEREQDLDTDEGDDLDKGEADESDQEPSLGSANADPDRPETLDQTSWGKGGQDDGYRSPDAGTAAFYDAQRAARDGARRDLDRMLRGPAPSPHSNVRIIERGLALWRPE